MGFRRTRKGSFRIKSENSYTSPENLCKHLNIEFQWKHKLVPSINARKKLSMHIKMTIGQTLPDYWEETKESLKFVKYLIIEIAVKEFQTIKMDDVPLTFDCNSEQNN